MGAKPSRSKSSKVKPMEGARDDIASVLQKNAEPSPPAPSTGFPHQPASPSNARAPEAAASVAATHADDIGLPGMLETESPIKKSGTPTESLPPAPEVIAPASQPIVDIEPAKQIPNEKQAEEPVDTSLELPIEEVMDKAADAFGQITLGLSSTKWDRRVQALQGMVSILKGLDIKGCHGMDKSSCLGRGLQLRDGKKCFHAACLVLNVVMKDKVLPVLLVAHELYRITFEHGKAAVTEDEVSRASKALLPQILAKLGDLNIRLHESASSCMLFTAMQPTVGLPFVLAKLLALMEGKGQQASALRGQQKMRVHYGILQTVEQLIKQSPGRKQKEERSEDAAATWTAADVIPFVVIGLHADSVTGSRVQQSALSLALDVYASLGKAALLPVRYELTPAARDLLIARFEEEGEDLDDMEEDDGDEECIELTGADSLCVFGVALKPLKPQATVTAPKTNTTDHEENLMDNILEDAGLVFDGHALGKKQPMRSALDDELTGILDNLDTLDEDDLDRLTTAESLPDDEVSKRRLHGREVLLS